MLLSILLENFNDDLTAIARQLNLDPQVLHNQLKSIDPTQKHGNFILRLIKSKNIRWPEDAFRIGEAIKVFTRVKPRLPVDSRDINKFKTILELENVVEPLVNTSSKRHGGLGFDPISLPGVEVVKTVGNYRVIRVSDQESLKLLGEGTKWCTRGSYGDCQAENYIDDYDWIFILFVGDVPIVQWTPDYSQVMDRNDEELVDRSLAQLIGYEASALNNGIVAYRYARYVIDGRWLEAEPTIMKDVYIAHYYARDIIKGRWPEAEPVILSNLAIAYEYARDIIKGRWPEAEPIILTDAVAAFSYVRDIIEDRWPEAESTILKDVYIAYCYARDIIKGRWPEAEPIILTNIQITYDYICDVIKGRWPAAEPTILNSKHADQYKKFVNSL